MSRQLLEHFNGARNGLFAEWLRENPGTPRIAWYPSPGTDFHNLLYLNSRYSADKKDPAEQPAEPELVCAPSRCGGTATKTLSLALAPTLYRPKNGLPITRKIDAMSAGTHRP